MGKKQSVVTELTDWGIVDNSGLMRWPTEYRDFTLYVIAACSDPSGLRVVGPIESLQILEEDVFVVADVQGNKYRLTRITKTYSTFLESEKCKH